MEWCEISPLMMNLNALYTLKTLWMCRGSAMGMERAVIEFYYIWDCEWRAIFICGDLQKKLIVEGIWKIWLSLCDDDNYCETIKKNPLCVKSSL